MKTSKQITSMLAMVAVVVAASLVHGATFNVDIQGSSAAPPTGARGPGGDGTWNQWNALSSATLSNILDSEGNATGISVTRVGLGLDTWTESAPPPGPMNNLYKNSMRLGSGRGNPNTATFTFSGLTANGEYDLYVYNGRPGPGVATYICDGVTYVATGNFTDGTYDEDSDYVIFSSVSATAEGTLILEFVDTAADPAIAGFQLVEVLPATAGVTVSPTTLSVTEGGATDSYTVVLNTEPSDSVTVTPSVAGGQVTLSESTLTFTTANWATPQTITVTAIDDSVDEGAHSATITHAATSADGDYDGATIDDVTVNITDNDTAGVTVSKATVSVAEEGTTSEDYTIVLDSEPTDDVTITLDVSEGGQVTLSDSELTFTAGNWDTAQTITVTAIDDELVEGPHSVTISHTAASDDAKYHGIAIDSVTVNIIDNDADPGVTVSEETVSVTEGGATDSYTILLNAAPTHNVTITPSATGGQVTFSPTALEFTTANWATPQTITVTAVDDDIDEDSPHTDTITHAATSDDGDYNGITIDSITVNITDNDTAGVTVSETTLSVDEEGPTSDTYTIVLDTQPADDVTITLDVSESGQVTLSTSTLTFTAANWSTPQTITVTAIDDDVEEGIHSVTITHAASSDDAKYEGITIASVTVNITDNDMPPPDPIIINVNFHGDVNNPPTGAMGPGGDGVWNVWAVSSSATLSNPKDSDDNATSVSVTRAGLGLGTLSYTPPAGPMYNMFTSGLRIGSGMQNPNTTTFTFSGLKENGEYDLYVYNARHGATVTPDFICDGQTKSPVANWDVDETYDEDEEYVIFKSVSATAEGTLILEFVDKNADPVMAGFQLVEVLSPAIGIVNASPIDFGAVAFEGTQDATVTVTNSGAAVLNISDITITGDDDDSFEILNPPSYPVAVAVADSTDISLRYTAGETEATSTATLNVFSDSTPNPTNITLTGVAFDPDAAPEVTGFTDDRDGADVTTNVLVTYTVVFNMGIDATSVDTDDFGNAGTAGMDIISISPDTGSSASFTVGVKATSSGTLQLQILDGATITNTVDVALDTTSAILSDEEITVETTPPTLSSPTVPPNEATDVALDINLEASFSENIAAGTGNITITNLTAGGKIDIDVTVGAPQISISGDTLTINPTDGLEPFTEYAVLMVAGVVVDDPAGNPFGGIADTNVWKFTTVDIPRTYTWNQTGAGTSGNWTTPALWDSSPAGGGYPDDTDTANLTGAIASGAYTSTLDTTIPGTLAALTINSGDGGGQAILAVANASLDVTTLNLGNGGVLRIENGGTVTNNASDTANWWTGTSGKIYLNEEGKLTAPNAVSIGYQATGINATISSTDGVGGRWDILGEYLRIGFRNSSNSLTIENGAELYVPGISVGYPSNLTNARTADYNNFNVGGPGAASHVSVADKVYVGDGGGNADSSSYNKMTVTNATVAVGSDLLIGRPSAPNNLPPANYNQLTVLGDGTVTVTGNILISQGAFTGNSLAITNGTVSASGLTILGTSSSVSVADGGELDISGTVTSSGATTPTFTLGAGSQITASAATLTGTVNVGFDDAQTPTSGRLNVSGTLNISEATLDLGSFIGTHIIAEYGTRSGTFAATNGLLDDGFIVYDYGDGNNQIAVIAEKSGTVFRFR